MKVEKSWRRMGFVSLEVVDMETGSSKTLLESDDTHKEKKSKSTKQKVEVVAEDEEEQPSEAVEVDVPQEESTEIEAIIEEKEEDTKDQFIFKSKILEEEFPEELSQNEWVTNYGLNKAIARQLIQLNLESPTEIQRKMLSNFKRSKSPSGLVFAKSPTGTGKTLAFALPIINAAINAPVNSKGTPEHLTALIFAPTRELALQIKKDIAAAAPKGIHVVSVVGGMSEEKQERQLSRCPHILVATPGRLAELCKTLGEEEASEDNESNLTTWLVGCKFLVFDEADRMLLQKGKFKDLDSLMLTIGSSAERQVVLLSATLAFETKQIQNDLRKMLHIPQDFEMKPVILESKTKTITDEDGKDAGKIAFPSALNQLHLLCETEELEASIWEILFARMKRSISNPSASFGRILIFANSIQYVRSLSSTLRVLMDSFPKKQKAGIPALSSLHAQQNQRHRLKVVDAFKSKPSGILVSTDVAARGIHITGIDMVIHAHVPHTYNDYVHRCGRTARAGSTGGTSVLIATPQETPALQAVLKKILDSKTTNECTVDQAAVDHWNREIIPLALNIAKIESKESATRSQQAWNKRASEQFGFGEAEEDTKESDDTPVVTTQTKQMRLQLASLFHQ